MPDTPAYSAADELASAITHGLGVVLSVAAGAVLITLAVLTGDPWTITGASVFVGTLVLVYTSSTLYHAIPYESAKAKLKTLDHCAIFGLIAGTYTPFLIGGLRGPWGWWLFGIIWALAAAGIVFKLFFTGRFKLVSTLIYVAMGWLVVVATGPLRAELPGSTLAWLVAGGLAYTAGTLFYLARFRFAHAVWHGFVLAGSVCHFAAVLVEVLRVGI
ncbi:hemolysin III [Rubrivirga sp. SAORIC476]|uniref:PAQR family membrane homeostasis protein TrhA n=1 Tax=Rubrivirga sp. SAORIC476 TaxID=1961794 RepID=UPI000BA94081|nr:hemolysin III family protein [Rubrivirga sp. SAORIC476]MAQ93949.1 hemolysin III [Rhodothermaceae bacterium]MBC14690.1 hemolysin III [Rhodothermaceae bacterium]PAP80394.1 hemolysin III [Rubrivirga sp. SAORIC476]